MYTAESSEIAVEHDSPGQCPRSSKCIEIMRYIQESVVGISSSIYFGFCTTTCAPDYLRYYCRHRFWMLLMDISRVLISLYARALWIGNPKRKQRIEKFLCHRNRCLQRMENLFSVISFRSFTRVTSRHPLDRPKNKTWRLWVNGSQQFCVSTFHDRLSGGNLLAQLLSTTFVFFPSGDREQYYWTRVSLRVKRNVWNFDLCSRVVTFSYVTTTRSRQT